MPRLEAKSERWPIEGTFRIARGDKRIAEVVVVELSDGDAVGRGECVPYARYGETVAGVLARIEGLDAGRLTLGSLDEQIGPGAARFAVHSALLELEARRRGCTPFDILGVAPPRPVPTLRTISIDAPRAMAAAARGLGASPLKLKLAGDDDDLARVEAVRRAVGRDAQIICDPNEALTVAGLVTMAPRLLALGVTLIEQPVPADADAELARVDLGELRVCADEAIHTRADLEVRSGRYDAINVKLGKSGGADEALALCREAKARGMAVMVGCMVCTSLAIAPAFALSTEADLFDLDGPLLLERDRDGGVTLSDGLLHPPTLWF